MSVKRVFVEKKPEYAIKARELREEIASYLDITGVTGVRVLVRYDIENISEDVYKEALGTIFSEPPVDDVFEETFPHSADDVVFSVEYLPGQFDQRADSAEQCVKLLNENEEPVIRSAMTYVISGKLSAEEIAAIKSFCINRWTPERRPRRSRRHLSPYLMCRKTLRSLTDLRIWMRRLKGTLRFLKPRNDLQRLPSHPELL